MKKRCTSIIIILLLLLSIVSPFICSIKVYANYETGTDDGGALRVEQKDLINYMVYLSLDGD